MTGGVEDVPPPVVPPLIVSGGEGKLIGTSIGLEVVPPVVVPPSEVVSPESGPSSFGVLSSPPGTIGGGGGGGGGPDSGLD